MYLILVTQKGFLKKVDLADISQMRKSGLAIFSLKKDDQIISIKEIFGGEEVILISVFGKIIRFQEKEIRIMGRQASGIKGIRLKNNDQIVSAEVFDKKIQDIEILIITENGFGKKVKLKEIKTQKRGGGGMIVAKINEKTGKIASANLVESKDKDKDLLVISKQGQTLKISLTSVPQQRRTTQGVKVMRFSKENDQVSSVSIL